MLYRVSSQRLFPTQSLKIITKLSHNTATRPNWSLIDNSFLWFASASWILAWALENAIFGLKIVSRWQWGFMPIWKGTEGRISDDDLDFMEQSDSLQLSSFSVFHPVRSFFASTEGVSQRNGEIGNKNLGWIKESYFTIQEIVFISNPRSHKCRIKPSPSTSSKQTMQRRSSSKNECLKKSGS